MSRALVIGPGGLRGAYSGGVVATLGKELGNGYFDAVYACSAGAYTASYLVSGQPEVIEAIWRNCVHDNLLVHLDRLVKPKQPILDLFYLNNVLRSEKYHLDIDKMLESQTKLYVVATEKHAGIPHYFNPKTEEEFFQQVRASAAVPFLHPEVAIGGKIYVDGMMTDPFAIQKALEDNHEEIIVVGNKDIVGISLSTELFIRCYAIRVAQPRLLDDLNKKIAYLDDLKITSQSKIRFIEPSDTIQLSWQFGASKETINALVDLGIKDACSFLSKSQAVN